MKKIYVYIGIIVFILIIVGMVFTINYIVKREQAMTKQTTSEEAKTPQSMQDKEIIDTIVDNFMLLAKVPRPSHHEEKISNFLMDWAKNQGFKPVQDSVNNVMFDVPATKGMENKPLGILQVHMDMVVAVEDGKQFDPLNDTITVIRNDNEGTLTADGTSLGADDGSGIAIVMAVVQGKMAHGPLRIIITVDEEDGMEGAFNVDKAWLDGASYLINVDNEASNEVLVSTASGDTVRINKEIAYIAPTGTTAINVELSNLKGGHSGVEIDKGRLNGIVGLANFMKQLNDEGINYELASFEGGTAANAIPTKASAVLVIDSSDKDIIEQKMTSYCDTLNNKYKGIEENIKYKVIEVEELPQVVSNEEKNNIIKFVTEVIDGVYTWSSDMEGLVESSSNLGLLKLNNDGLSITSMARSSSAEKETEICNKQLALAKECNLEIDITKTAVSWPYDPNSKLLEIAKKVYKDQNGEDINVVAVHAGVECGTFKAAKPELDMISIGPDLKDVHTINEILYLKTIPKVWHLLEGILAEYPGI